MTQDDEWSKRLARVVATEVKRHRKLRKMSAQRLSDATAELGSPIPRTVLSNFENGRRPTISLAELLVIARALEVPPVLLLSPLGREERVEVLPGVLVDPWLALKWVAGEEDSSDLPGRLDWQGIQQGKDETRTVALFRDHDHWAYRLVEAQGQLWEARQRLGAARAPGSEPDPGDPEATREYRRRIDEYSQLEISVEVVRRSVDDAERSLRRVREDIRSAGMTPPKLWPQLSYLEGSPDEQE